jgi:MSHA biogenesis protein MshJ
LKEQWQKQVARFDALGARERALIFIGAIVCTILLAHELALDPLAVRQKRLSGQLAETRQNANTTESLIRSQEMRTDPDAVKRSYAQAVRKQLAEIDQNMQGLQRGLVPPERMAKLLEEMLARGGRLQLVSLRTLPVQRFEHPAAPTGAKPADKETKAAGKDPERSIYQHSYELTLQGSYADLHAYLARLEELPWQMFWGRIALDTESYPRLQVTLTVHTLSLSKAWLIV